MEQLEDLKNKIIEKYRDYIKNISYRFHLSYRAEDWFEFEIEFSKCNSNYNTITFNDTCENLDIKQLESLIDEYMAKNVLGGKNDTRNK